MGELDERDELQNDRQRQHYSRGEPSLSIDATIESAKHELLRAIARSLFFVLTNPDGLTDEEANRIAREEFLKPRK